MRVIAGRLGGRTLVAPAGRETRPTTDRVREALFSILGDVSGARVLDLWAGTGALGIEALSRGAARAVLVESSRAATAAIARNVAALGIDDATRVIAARVECSTRVILGEAPFDLVLADPPWADVPTGAAPVAIAALVHGGALRDAEARVVLELATGDAPPAIEGLSLAERRVYGDTSLAFYTPA